MFRESVAKTMENWADPTVFIKAYRRLKKEWRPVSMPIGTYKRYRGFEGL